MTEIIVVDRTRSTPNRLRFRLIRPIVRIIGTISAVLTMAMVLLSVEGKGQMVDYTDLRDGEVYKVVEIDGLEWMTRNMVIPDSEAHFADRIDAVQHMHTNYYKHRGVDSLCPVGWRLPTINEFNKAMKHIANSQGYGTIPLKVDSSLTNLKGHLSSVIQVVDTTDRIIWVDEPILRLKPIYWVQGERFRTNGSHTWWLGEVDPYYHVHLSDHNYVIHSHRFHINEQRQKRNRRFAVRCVR